MVSSHDRSFLYHFECEESRGASIGLSNSEDDLICACFAGLHAVGDDAKRKGLDLGLSFFATFTIDQRARNLFNLRDPAAVVFPIKNDCEVHRGPFRATVILFR
jgi:hypothetical protein